MSEKALSTSIKVVIFMLRRGQIIPTDLYFRLTSAGVCMDTLIRRHSI